MRAMPTYQDLIIFEERHGACVVSSRGLLSHLEHEGVVGLVGARCFARSHLPQASPFSSAQGKARGATDGTMPFSEAGPA